MIAVAVVAGASAGLASIPHCAGMCGPLAAFAGRTRRDAGLYQAGRLAAYVALGAAAGLAGEGVERILPAAWAGALVSFSLAAALLVSAWRLWRRDGETLVQLGTKPPRESWSRRLAARVPFSTGHPGLLGALTGLLPCGTLYAALLLAAGTGDTRAGAVTMFAFGATSALGLAVVGAVAAQVRGLMRRGAEPTFFARVLATCLLVGGILLAMRPISTLARPDAAPCHTEANAR
ncbi:MAG: sulfite exporter TauE/SafE family protein [Sandaracinaceae bacterium]